MRPSFLNFRAGGLSCSNFLACTLYMAHFGCSGLTSEIIQGHKRCRWLVLFRLVFLKFQHLPIPSAGATESGTVCSNTKAMATEPRIPEKNQASGCSMVMSMQHDTWRNFSIYPYLANFGSNNGIVKSNCPYWFPYKIVLSREPPAQAYITSPSTSREP